MLEFGKMAATGSPTIVLQNGFSLSDLTSCGSTIEINTSFRDYYEDSDFVDTPTTVIPADTIGEPITKTFEELKLELTSIDKAGMVKKKILVEGGGSRLTDKFTVTIVFSGYWEQANDPFDFCSARKPLVVDLANNALLPGLQTAVKSMLVGEESMFLLSYHVMFGIMGLPPRIKPKSDCVYYIRLWKSRITSEISTNAMIDVEENIFQKVMKEAKLLYTSGVQFGNGNNLPAAIRCFSRAVYILQRCRLANEHEETKQEKFLKKLHINLAVCYIKAKQPLKACCQINELNRLENIWTNGKALYQNARALRMIGEFDQAEKRLRRALQLCPENTEIEKEFEMLDKQKQAYEKSKTFLVIKEITIHESSPLSKEEVSQEFKTEAENLVVQFKSDVNLYKLTMPPGLSAAEIDYIKSVADKHGVTCNNLAFDKIEEEDDKPHTFSSSCDDLITF